MSTLAQWLEREARDAERGVTLDEALVGDRGLRYAVHRLRYTLPRAVLRTGLHAFEIAVVASAFRFEYVAPLIAIRSAVTIIGALWWGALERLRTQVREDASRRDFGRARLACEAWLSYSVDLGLLLLLGLLCWLHFGPELVEGFSVFDAFAIACVLRAILESVARAYHAGVAALRRVYRPLASILIPDVLEVAAVVALLPVLGLWSLSLVVLAGGVVRSLLVVRYSRLAYTTTRLVPPRWQALGSARKKLPLRRELGMLRHAVANLSSRIDAVVVVALLAAAGERGLYLAVTFHLLQPLLAAAQRWAGFFYLDFLVLRGRRSPFLQRRFERLLLRAALWFALATALLVVPVVLAVQREFPGPFLALLVVFLLLRSFLGLYQVRAFAFHQHRYLAKLSVGVLLVVAVTVYHFEGSTALPVLLTLVAALLVALRPPAPEHSHAYDACPRLPLLTWLGALKEQREPLWVAAAAVDRRAGVPRSKVLRALAGSVPRGAISSLGRRHLLCFGFGPLAPDLRRRLIVAGGGCLANLELTAASSGAEALERAMLLLARIDAERRPASLLDRDALCARFRRQFPDGRILDAESGGLRGLDRATLRAVTAALRGVDGRRAGGSKPIDVAVYAPSGLPSLVFAMDVSSPIRARADFRALVERQSLAATVQ